MAPSAHYSTFTLNHQQWNLQVDWKTVELYYMLFNISKMVVLIYHPAVVNETYYLFTYGLLIFASVVEVKQYIIVFTNYFPAYLNKLRIFSCVFSQSCFLYLGMFIPFCRVLISSDTSLWAFLKVCCMYKLIYLSCCYIMFFLNIS